MNCATCGTAEVASLSNEIIELRATLARQEKDAQRTIDLLKATNRRTRKQANLASEAARLHACMLLKEIAELQISNKHKTKQLANRAAVTKDGVNKNRIADMASVHASLIQPERQHRVEHSDSDEDSVESKTPTESKTQVMFSEKESKKRVVFLETKNTSARLK